MGRHATLAVQDSTRHPAGQPHNHREAAMTYPVGAYFVTQIEGPVGFLIALAQLLCGKPSAYGHAGIVVTADGGTIEAQPGGARPGNLADYAHRQTRVCDGPVRRQVAAGDPHHVLDPRTEAQIRADVAAAAQKLRGTGYSILDYFALACLHLHLPSKWVRQRVESSGHLICSALVDRAYSRAGIQLFAGKLPGDVMPADLADWADTWLEQRQEAAA